MKGLVLLRSARLQRISLAANVLGLLLVIAFFARRAWLAGGGAGARLYAGERLTILEALPRREGGTVFLGDSLTDRGEWAELFGDATIQNRGVAGDTTRDILARLPGVVASRPARVLLLAGVNDLAAGEPVPAIAERYGAVVAALREGAPGARVLCQSVLPVREGLAPKAITNRAILELNEAIARVAAERGCAYVDVRAALLDDSGQLAARFTLDGLHLTGAGYSAWAAVLAPLIQDTR